MSNSSDSEKEVSKNTEKGQPDTASQAKTVAKTAISIENVAGVVGSASAGALMSSAVASVAAGVTGVVLSPVILPIAGAIGGAYLAIRALMAEDEQEDKAD